MKFPFNIRPGSWSFLFFLLISKYELFIKIDEEPISPDYTVLTANGFNEMKIQLAQSQVISRAMYPASEQATARWSLENSAVMALTCYDPEKMNKDRLYKSALKLHSIKEKMDVYTYLVRQFEYCNLYVLTD